MKTTRRIMLLLALATIGLVGCGDDDDTTDASSNTTEGGAAEGDLATYCDKVFEIETVGEPDVDFEHASQEEQVTAIKAFAADKLQALAAEIQAVSPPEIKEAIDVQVAAVDKLAETGDFESTFGTPEVDAASKTTHDFDLKSCDWQPVAVTAVNYAFQGIPATLDAGKTSFDLTNQGTEVHEVVVIRKNDDTTESFDELLALPEEEAQSKTTVVGSAFAAAGDDDYAVVDLEAGEYIALCFIPEGTTDEQTEGHGPPHFTKGMRQEFTVS